MEKKDKNNQNSTPYLHELTENPNYEVKSIVPRDFQVGNPNDSYDTFHKIFYDKKLKNLIVSSTKELKEGSAYHIKILKVDVAGNIVSKTNSIGNILNNGTTLGFRGYSTWVINNDTTSHKYKSLFTKDEKDDIGLWFPKFKEAYIETNYIYLDTSLGEYYFLINNSWFKVEYQLDQRPKKLTEKFPPKEPKGRMIVLEDATPDFFTDPAERDTSLIKVLGYGQEYFEEGQGDNPINGSAGHYYMQLNMQKDTLRFKRFSTMGTQLTIYKIPEELSGHPDVVFIVQTRNAMFPDQEFGGMYVVRPRELGEKYKDQ